FAASWPEVRRFGRLTYYDNCAGGETPASRDDSHASSDRRPRLMAKPQPIRRRALRLLQDEAHPLYVFSLTGEELLRVADISRSSRDDAGRVIGYQRQEVRRHVQDIVNYLDGESVLFPNSIILALSSAVRFTGSRGPGIDDGLATSGTIEIPVP